MHSNTVNLHVLYAKHAHNVMHLLSQTFVHAIKCAFILHSARGISLVKTSAAEAVIDLNREDDGIVPRQVK